MSSDCVADRATTGGPPAMVSWQKTPYDAIVIAPLEACNGYGALREFRADPHTHTLLDVAAHIMADDSLYNSHAAVGLTIAPYEDDITGESFDPFDDSITLLPLCKVLHRLLPSAAARGDLANLSFAGGGLRIELVVYGCESATAAVAHAKAAQLAAPRRRREALIADTAALRAALERASVAGVEAAAMDSGSSDPRDLLAAAVMTIDALVKAMLPTRTEETVVDLALKLASEKCGDINVAFLEAVRCGDCDIARAFVQTLGVNVDAARDRNDRTALHHAAITGDAAMVKLLAGNFGACPEARCDDGRTPLLYAALGGHAGIVRDLANTYRANANARQRDGWTALHLAANNDHAEVARVLVAELGVSVDEHSTDSSEDPPVENPKEEEEEASLLVMKLLSKLLAARTTPKAATALHHAAEQGNTGVARVLIELGADVNARCSVGYTPLHWATLKNRVQVATLLIDSKADLNAKQRDGWTPLHIAAENGREDVCQALLATGHRIDVNIAEEESRTPLHIAAEKGEVGVLQLLAKDGRASTAAICKFCRTPLHWAAFKGKADVIRVLVLDMKADVNVPQSDDGWTALHLAAANGHTEAVRALVNDLGASTTAVDNERKTAEERARLRGHIEIVNLLFAARNPKKANNLRQGCSLQ